MVDDTISRHMAINHLKTRLIETALNNVGIITSADDVYIDIADNRLNTWVNEIPDAERKTGKWIDDDGHEVKHGLCANCSACGEWSEYLTDFCPNCGAYMRK